MIRLKLLLALLLLLLLADVSTSFATTRLQKQKNAQRQLVTRSLLSLQSSSRDEPHDDWLAEMKSQTCDALQENKEPLFDHDDWVKYRSPERRMNDAFDVSFPLLAAFVVFLLGVAIQL